ncbi:hypothetical protein D3C71_1831170 [compost metagenome]
MCNLRSICYAEHKILNLKHEPANVMSIFSRKGPIPVLFERNFLGLTYDLETSAMQLFEDCIWFGEDMDLFVDLFLR